LPLFTRAVRVGSSMSLAVKQVWARANPVHRNSIITEKLVARRSFSGFVVNVLIVSVFYDGRLDDASPSEFLIKIPLQLHPVRRCGTVPHDSDFEGKGRHSWLGLFWAFWWSSHSC